LRGKENIEKFLATITAAFITKSVNIAKEIAKINIYDIAYFSGIIIFEVILGVLITVFSGGAAAPFVVAKATKNIRPLVDIFLKELLETLTLGIPELLKYLNKLLKQFFQAAQNGWEALAKFIDDWLNPPYKSEDIEDILIVGKTKSKRKKIINDVESGKTKLDEDALGNKRKKGDQTRASNYAEMKMDEYFETQTFRIGKNEGTLRRVSSRTVNTLDDKITRGIDGIYEFSSPPPHYIITEVKYNTATLSKVETTSGGSQMSKKWIKRDIEFGAVSPVIADDILLLGYEPLLCNVSKTGTVTINKIDQTTTSAKKNGKWNGKTIN
jgi:hypothetical protein